MDQNIKSNLFEFVVYSFDVFKKNSGWNTLKDMHFKAGHVNFLKAS